MDEGLSENDPYRNMSSAQDNIKPELPGHSRDGSANNSGNAAAFLSSAENGAAQSPSQSEGGLDNIRQNEQDGGDIPQSGFYSGAGKTSPAKGKGKGLFKKGRPLIFISLILSMVMFGTASFGGHTSQIVSWKENIFSMFGQSSAIINSRSNTIFSRILNTNKSVTSALGNKLKVSESLAKKLAAENIHYVETNDSDGKMLKILVFQDTDGSYTPIVASDADVARVNSLTNVDIDGETVTLKPSSGITLDNAKVSNKNFSVNLDAATLTFSGKIAGWFDKVTDVMYDTLIGKSARNQTNIDNATEEEVDEMLLKNSSTGADDADTDIKRTVEVEDENGETTTVVERYEGDSDAVKTDYADTNSAATGVRSVLEAKVTKVAQATANIGCGVLQSLGAINATVGAIQVINSINYASKYLEIADKIKAGDADEVTHHALNNINEPVTTTAYTKDGDEVTYAETSVSASPGWNTVFSDRNIVDEDDPPYINMFQQCSAVCSDLVENCAGGFQADLFPVTMLQPGV